LVAHVENKIKNMMNKGNSGHEENSELNT